MEDAHTHILSLPSDKEASFFAVYDGHGGQFNCPTSVWLLASELVLLQFRSEAAVIS